MAMDEMSSESNIIRTYLEWMACLPYGVQSEDQFDVAEAKAILDKDHFGMKEIKVHKLIQQNFLNFLPRDFRIEY